MDWLAIGTGAMHIFLSQFSAWQSATLFLLLALYGLARLYYYVKDKESRRIRERELHEVDIEMKRIELDDAKKNECEHVGINTYTNIFPAPAI